MQAIVQAVSQLARAGAGAMDALVRRLLPCGCALCGVVQQAVVCADCADELLRPVARCPQCALPSSGARLCAICRASPPAFDATVTLGDYASPQDGLVLALKFGGQLALAGWLAQRLMAQYAQASDAGLPLPDLLAPVPLSPSRLAGRGFNQAWEIARPLARRLRVRTDPVLLRRRRDTAAQSTLALADRHANIEGAFALAPRASVAGLHIGLVDDVMTTGATLDEAARMLKAQGAGRVTAIVALRTA